MYRLIESDLYIYNYIRRIDLFTLILYLKYSLHDDINKKIK